MKRCCILLLVAMSAFAVQAQDIDARASLMGSEMNDFDSFINDADREFTGFLRNPWKQFDAAPPVEARVKPEPPKPPVYDGTGDGKPVEINVSVKPEPTPRLEPEGVSLDDMGEPDRVGDVQSQPKPSVVSRKPGGTVSLSLFGVEVSVDNRLKGKCRLRSLDPDGVADAYEELSRTDFAPLLADMSAARTAMRLNDWGMVVLVRKVAKAFCEDHNTEVVMSQFLLNQLGLSARMARRADNGRMMLFVATGCQVYGKPYTTRGGINYYDLDDNAACRFFMFDGDYGDKVRPVSMSLKQIPRLVSGYKTCTRSNSKGDISVTVNVNESLMQYYASMPQCDYRIYTTAATDSVTSKALLKALSAAIEGMEEAEAANRLIDFVQTAFHYATDEEQFGYEKPFFMEETFFYPSCDCEDRAVLYSFLVRNLLGLDVVLLDYPEHIATAVAFHGDVRGDYVMYKGRRYTVCDPTYIGASIGTCMPQFRNVEAKVM